jgi:hypothetical protein
MTNPEIRVSDAERELVAVRLREAAAEGRLTMPEADDRLAAAYAAVTRGDLVPLTADLPQPPPAPPVPVPLSTAAKRRLGIHAAIVAVILVNIVVRAAIFGFPFVPVGPMVFLALTVFVHYRIARRRSVAPAPRDVIAA